MVPCKGILYFSVGGGVNLLFLWGFQGKTQTCFLLRQFGKNIFIVIPVKVSAIFGSGAIFHYKVTFRYQMIFVFVLQTFPIGAFSLFLFVCEKVVTVCFEEAGLTLRFVEMIIAQFVCIYPFQSLYKLFRVNLFNLSLHSRNKGFSCLLCILFV